MKKSRYTEEQIIGILKQHQAGLGAKGYAASTASAMRPSTSGGPVMAGWKCRMPGG